MWRRRLLVRQLLPLGGKLENGGIRPPRRNDQTDEGLSSPAGVAVPMLRMAAAQDLAWFEKRVMSQARQWPDVLLLVRPQAPVFSFFTIVDAGDAQDPNGKTGLAHMMEHMVFKGPHHWHHGYAAEKLALDEGVALSCADVTSTARTIAWCIATRRRWPSLRPPGRRLRRG